MRGNCLSNLEKYSDAIASYNRAISLNPNCSNAWVAKAKTFLRMGQTAKADDALSTAEKIRARRGKYEC